MTILTYYEYLLDRNLSHSSDSYKQYRKYYQRLYQRQRRRQGKEITVFLAPDDHIQLKAAALKHHLSLSKFITSASLSYLNTKYITPEKQLISQVLQQLSFTYSQIQYLADQVTRDREVSTARQALAIVSKLEATLEKLLTNPDSLEIVIQKTLHSYPHYYQTLSKLLRSYDHQSKSLKEA